MPEEVVKVPCEVCKKEIPKSVALSPEGMEIIAYFCSTECMDYWAAAKENLNKNE